MARVNFEDGSYVEFGKIASGKYFISVSARQGLENIINCVEMTPEEADLLFGDSDKKPEIVKIEKKKTTKKKTTRKKRAKKTKTEKEEKKNERKEKVNISESEKIDE